MKEYRLALCAFSWWDTPSFTLEPPELGVQMAVTGPPLEVSQLKSVHASGGLTPRSAVPKSEGTRSVILMDAVQLLTCQRRWPILDSWHGFCFSPKSCTFLYILSMQPSLGARRHRAQGRWGPGEGPGRAEWAALLAPLTSPLYNGAAGGTYVKDPCSAWAGSPFTGPESWALWAVENPRSTCPCPQGDRWD